MGREELERLGALLFGYGWKSRLADVMDVNRKTVSRWIADDDVAPWAAERLRAMVSVSPPPGTTDADDRDDACQDALEPELTRLAQMAVDAGWNPAEVSAAILGLTVAEIAGKAGKPAAREVLREVLDALT
jgi:hypothetical protein